METRDVTLNECLYCSPIGLSIKYQEPNPETPLVQSLLIHKGNLMANDYLTAFTSVARKLGLLRSSDVVCRWSSIHNAVSTVQKLENNIELRTTWFAKRSDKEIMFTVYHNGEEIITDYSNVEYLVEQVMSILEKTKT